MSGAFELLVFDWDGTLMDSMPRIVDCLQAAATDKGLPIPARAACLNIIGLGLHEAIARLFPGAGEATVRALADAYRAHYQGQAHAPQSLFPRVRETLESLRARGYLLAVATAKGRRGLEAGLETAGLEPGFFHSSRCGDEAASKPDPQMLLEIIEELDQSAKRTLMVGDTVYDMTMAARAGAAGLAVSYGAHDRERLLTSGPVHCIGCLSELPGWLSSNTE